MTDPKRADPERRNTRGGVAGVLRAWDRIGRLRARRDDDARVAREIRRGEW